MSLLFEDVYYGRCAGIDVHKEFVVVCLRIGRKTELRKFSTVTRELREMVAWLKENGCQMVAMESSGSYWKPIYNILEQEEVPAMVCNAYHIKNVPGRKTDVNDATWIAKMPEPGIAEPKLCSRPQPAGDKGTDAFSQVPNQGASKQYK